MGDTPVCGLSSMELSMDETPICSGSSARLLDDEASSRRRSNAEISADDYMSSHRISSSEHVVARAVTGDTSRDIWLWIIEYLAKFKTDPSMIHEVFEMGPELPDDLGQYVNEMVAFRCLTFLFDPSNEQNVKVTSSSEPKIEFDLSDSCEHVLQCILDEVSLSDLKPGGPELSKWNVLPFITHKRLYLPKCALELLSDARRENTEPVFDPLRETSGLVPRNEPEITRLSNEKDQVGLEFPSQNSALRTVRVGGSIDQVPVNGYGLLGDGLSVGYPLCFETNRSDVMITDNSTENNGRKQDTTIIDEKLCTYAKKLKLDASDANLPVDRLLILSHCTEFLENESKHINVAEMGSDLSKDNEAGRTKEIISLGHDHDEGIALTANDVNNSNNETKVFNTVGGSPRVTGEARTFSTVELQILGQCPSNQARDRVDPVKDNAQNRMDHTSKSDSTETMSQIEKADVATRQGRPLTPSNQYMCQKCKRGGYLLVCSATGCVFMVHENCLPIPPQYDEKGEFYCPQCTYTRVTSEYLQSRIEVAKAKEKLVSFLKLLNSRCKQVLAKRIGYKGPSDGERSNDPAKENGEKI